MYCTRLTLIVISHCLWRTWSTAGSNWFTGGIEVVELPLKSFFTCLESVQNARLQVGPRQNLAR